MPTHFCVGREAGMKRGSSQEGPCVVQASGAADGLIRLWAVQEGHTGAQALSPIGGLPARGFVNALHIARSARFVLAGMGQEPRLGRWARDAQAKNGLLLHQLSLEEDVAE